MEVPINDKGFTVLVEPENPIVDIVFIHGFTGHPKKTWTEENGGKSSKRNDRESAENGDITGPPPFKISENPLLGEKESVNSMADHRFWEE
jgi:hypothetical protein